MLCGARRSHPTRAAARALSAIAALAALCALSACARLPKLQERGGTAMGTFVEIKVASDDAAGAQAAMGKALDELARIEAIATPHDPASELSRINARTDSTFVAGPEIDAMLAAARAVSEASHGAFDLTIGGVATLWGFPEEPRLPDSSEIAAALSDVGWRFLRREPADPALPEARWVLSNPKTQLDLGGVACGWAVDRAAAMLDASSRSWILNAGGDILVRGVRPDGEPWRIGIQHPRDENALVATLRIPADHAIATSGDYEHCFVQDGVRYHHILDPGTGYPPHAVASVTVVAPTCLQADVWSTAAFVLGPVEGRRVLEEQEGLDGLFLIAHADGSIERLMTSGIAAMIVP